MHTSHTRLRVLGGATGSGRPCPTKSTVVSFRPREACVSPRDAGMETDLVCCTPQFLPPEGRGRG